MKNKELLFINEVTLENDRKMKLEYSIIESLESENGKPYYGIQIVKYIDGSTETEEIDGISYSRNKVESITRILYQNIVTPISMVEIVDDLITLEAV